MDENQIGLKQHHMKTSTVVFMIFCLCAAGAYGIEDMISEVGPGLTIIMLMVLPFVWSAPMGLVASELGSAIPEEGGYYKWVQRACGEFWGYQAGWWRTVSIYFDNCLYVALAGGYLASVLPQTENTGLIISLFKAAVVIVFTYINLRGIKEVGLVSSIISVLVMAAFATITVIGFTHWHYNPMVPFVPPGQSLLQSIGYGIAIGMWMYGGYESMSTVAGEVENPQVIPRATIITVPLIMAVYILPTIAGLGSIGQWDSWGSDVGCVSYSDIAEQNGFAGLGLFFVFVAVMANFSIFNTYITSGSRGFFALAEDNLAPKFLVKCSKKQGVPYIAVLSLGIFTLIVSQFRFDVIVVVDMMLLMSAYVLIFISGIILRIKEGDMPRPFRIPVGTAGFIGLCICPIIIAFIALYINGTDYFLGGLVAMLSGPVTYFIFKRMYGGLSKKHPDKYPVNPKTKIGIGDTKKMAWMFAGLTVIGIIGCFFLPWYDDPQYYTDTYGIEGVFNILMLCIRYITIGLGVLTVILGFISAKVEPKESKYKA